MKGICYYIIGIIFFSLQLVGCKRESQSAAPLPLPPFALDTVNVQRLVRDMAAGTSGHMYADRYVCEYLDSAAALLWISPDGLNGEARVLLQSLQKVEAEGLAAESFYLPELAVLCDSIDSLVARREAVRAGTLLATVEYRLTSALLRYAYGRRYGFIRPARLFNNLLKDSEGGYRRIFDLPVEIPTDSLAQRALDAVAGKQLERFLCEQQPTAPLYAIFQKELARATMQNDTVRSRLARINMERARWRYPRPRERYVMVNLAAGMLTAVCPDSSLSMRVCQGTQKQKTPLLYSELKYMELNPYWVIPQTIVRKEIVPLHLHDSAYFARNNIVAIHNGTKEESDPTVLTRAELRSGQYTLRQEKGAGNSLGRMVFRFRNDFAVYLHDTNSPSAFRRSVRTVSHGCVRVQRPMELALFLLGEKAKDPFFVDRIRMSIDLKPLSRRGKMYQENTPEAEPLKTLHFKESTPLWLDYYTLWPDTDGTLLEFPDIYHYDAEIEKQLDRLSTRNRLPAQQ